ncbi:synaptonemal complex protein 2-like [Heptranchias perlo]|uniref:synaptonemal complex protein 2-like n=1 Tax=Heptranchias perlo TaxID=212740 RepID=UPI00355A3A15
MVLNKLYWCGEGKSHPILQILELQNLVWPPVESQLKTTSPVPNQVTVLESQRSTTDKFEISPSASDGELGSKTSSTQPEEQRSYSDTEIQYRKSFKITSKLKNSTPLVSSKSTTQNFSAIRSKDMLPVQNKSTENNEGVQSLDPKEGPSFDEAAARSSPRPSDTLSAKKISPPEITELQQKQNVDAEGKEAETSDRRYNMTPESKRATSKSLKRDVFHFETSSDSAANLLVSEAKRKVLGKKSPADDQVRNVKVATVIKKRNRRGEKVMHKRSDLKFFTEESSNEGTDHSWLLESQVKVTPKVSDYSKHKKRKKSVLRVLPLSFESSEDEEQKQKERKSTGKTHLQTRIEKQKMPHTGQMLSEFSELQNTPVSSQKAKRIKTDDFSIRKNLEMETPLISLLTPPDTQQKMTPPSPKFPERISLKGQVLANKECPSGGTATVQQSAKSPSEGSYSDSNYMDEDTLTPFLHYKPKRLFTSAEKYQEAEEPEETVQLIENSLFEVDDGDLSDPNISAAFQNFTEEMRKKLRFCYSKMERFTKQSLQSGEEKISTLLNQIHNYRLQKLNTFEETVVHQLKNLEEDTQTLKNLEEETLNFWKQQSLKFSQFYENQEQRMNALISFPEDKQEISQEIQVDVTQRMKES